MDPSASASALLPPPHAFDKAASSPTPPSAATTTTTASLSSSAAAADPKYNTRHLGLRLAADAFSGFTAASLVAPVIAIIDRAIMENASGANTLMASVTTSVGNLLRRPQQLLLSKPFGLICLLYGSTYCTANMVDTAASARRNLPATTTTAGFAKFVVPSAANVGICIYKDRVFVRMYGPPGVVPRPVPLPSYALFALRDCLTIFASFNIPPRLGSYLTEHWGFAGPGVSSGVLGALSGYTLAQFATPAVSQFATTPFHLLALDLYNRAWQQPRGPAAVGEGVASWADRFAVVNKNWLVSSVARICRVIPAYGVGGVVNTKMRYSFMKQLE